MNQFLKILLFSFLCFCGANSQAQTCTPYSIPMEPAVACGTGYTGQKFPMKTMVCPEGRITVGATYNTDNCKPVGMDSNSQYATNCAVTPTVVGCSAAPTLKGCEAGKHWVTTGSGIAHCVLNDYACPWGQSLTHDGLGNPSCIANTCPSNQVLQGDGISCACSSGLVWDGASCIAACTPVTDTQASACSSGYSGTRYRDRTKTCPSGTYVYGAWDTSSCEMICAPDTTTSGSCGAGYTGSTVITTTYSGPTCTASTSTDRSGCTTTIVPCPSSTTTFGTCGAGYTGSTTITTTYSGSSCTASSTTDRSGCTKICPATTTTTTNGSCGAGYTGNTVITTTTTYSGSSCTASSSSSTDSSGCVKTCPATTTVSSACAAPQVGTQVTTTTYSGPSCTASSTTNTSGCSMPPAPSCYFNDPYLGSDKNNPSETNLTLAAGGVSGQYCTGYTSNWAFYYRCSSTGVGSQTYLVKSGCGLFN